MPASVATDPAARPYAEALFELGQDEKRHEEIAAEMDGFIAVLRSDPKVREFFRSFRIPAATKIEFLDRVLAKSLSPTFLNFLKVAAKRARFILIEDVAVVYNELLDVRLGRVHCRLTTAVEPAVEEVQAVRDAVKAKVGKLAVLETRVKPELIGGFTLELGDSLVDASVSTRLARLRRNLLERATLEVQTRGDKMVSGL